MTIYILYAALILMIGLMLLSNYFIHRNPLVFKLQTEINEMCHAWCIREIRKPDFNPDTYESAYDWCMDKLPSYTKMVMSFRPLTLEEWLPAEMLERLKN